jgi:hypothetical protein
MGYPCEEGDRCLHALPYCGGERGRIPHAFVTQKRNRNMKIEPRLFTALFIELSHLSRSFPELVAVLPVRG